LNSTQNMYRHWGGTFLSEPILTVIKPALSRTFQPPFNHGSQDLLSEQWVPLLSPSDGIREGSNESETPTQDVGPEQVILDTGTCIIYCYPVPVSSVSWIERVAKPLLPFHYKNNFFTHIPECCFFFIFLFSFVFKSGSGTTRQG
jgi:hypothetical protein